MKTIKNNHKTLNLLISRCFEGDSPRGVNILIGEKYEIDGQPVKITEDTYDELVEYQETSNRKYKIERHGKFIKMIGVMR